jgi:shikimate kinase
VPPCIVVLVGLPGSGKSTTGALLARRMGVPFADSDALVEQNAGTSVQTLLTRDGEAAFRILEAAAIAGALTDFDGVLALGGGAVLTESTRRELRESGVPVALLTAEPAALLRRIGDGSTRPLLAPDPARRLAALTDQRVPLYAEVATFSVDTGGRRPAQVVTELAAALEIQLS